MKKVLLLISFLFLLSSFSLSKPSSAAASCTPPSTYILTNISSVYSYKNYSTGVCTDVSGGNYSNVYSGTTPTTTTGQTAVVNCGSTGSGLVYYASAGCTGTVRGYSGGACQSQTVSCTTPTSPPASTSTPVPTQPPSSCTPGAHRCPNGQSGYDQTHSYWQLCNSSGAWSNQSCSAGNYCFSDGNLSSSSTSGECVNSCTGFGDVCSTSCTSPQPNATQYQNPNYACGGSGTCCLAGAPTATPTPGTNVCTCYACVSGACVAQGSNFPAPCGPPNNSFTNLANCQASCTAGVTCNSNPNACSGLNCGTVWNGCAYVSCGSSCTGGESCVNNICTAASPTPPAGSGTVYSISGNVFKDIPDKDGILNNGETNYQGVLTLTICAGSTPSCTTPYETVQTASDGTYTANNLPAGQYNIALSTIPTGYQPTVPNGTPPSWTVTVGPSCSTAGAGAYGAQCQ